LSSSSFSSKYERLFDRGVIIAQPMCCDRYFWDKVEVTARHLKSTDILSLILEIEAQTVH
jgi:hypothetical protein